MQSSVSSANNSNVLELSAWLHSFDCLVVQTPHKKLTEDLRPFNSQVARGSIRQRYEQPGQPLFDLHMLKMLKCERLKPTRSSRLCRFFLGRMPSASSSASSITAQKRRRARLLVDEPCKGVLQSLTSYVSITKISTPQQSIRKAHFPKSFQERVTVPTSPPLLVSFPIFSKVSYLAAEESWKGLITTVRRISSSTPQPEYN